MAFRELYPIVVATVLWEHFWSTKRIVFSCDNEFTVHIINKGRSKVTDIMKLMRKLTWLAAKNNFTICSSNSRGKGDTLSSLLANNVELTKNVNALISKSVTSRTRTQYECGFSQYVTFLNMSGVKWNYPTDMSPLSEESLVHFATHCHINLGLKYSTIKLYICGIIYTFLEAGIISIFNSDCPSKLYRLEAVYRGIKKKEAKTTRTRLPIIFTTLKKICLLLRKGMFSPYIDCLMETARVIAFFGFLRCGEFTVLQSFDPESNACSEDITINDDHPTLHLKSSKTDPFRLGINILLFATGSSVCPVSSLKNLIEMRNCSTTDKDPFFILDNGLGLTRSYFIQHLRIIVSTLGFNSDLFNGHSFRIGAWTMGFTIVRPVLSYGTFHKQASPTSLIAMMETCVLGGGNKVKTCQIISLYKFIISLISL
jgi:hypothetical protein